MKKFFIFCMVALVAMCGLNSCSEDCDHNFIEVDYNKKLAGTWTTIDAENEFAEALIFNADGTVTSTGVFEGAFFEKKGTFKIKDNKITLSFEDGDGMESRFEMVEGKIFSMVDDELDVHFNYYYCENDLSDEIVGMWVSTQEAFGQEDGSVAINTFTENGKAYVTAFVPEIDSYINQGESDYKVIGNMLVTCVKYDANLPALYTAIEFDIIPDGTELGDIMISYNPVYGTSVSFLRVKQNLNLTNKLYAYRSAYVTNAKGADEDFNILGHTFNMAHIANGNFDMLFHSELFCVNFPNANTIKQIFRSNGQDVVVDIPITVEGNKVTLDMTASIPVLRKVEMYMFQDADDSQLHIYMPTQSFINYFANLEVVTMMVEGKLAPTDVAAVAKVYADMEARVESINVSFVMKAIEEIK